MKTATRYAADVATNMEKAVRRIQSAQGLSIHHALPTTSQEITRYIEQLLTVPEQAVCDMATD